MKPVMRVGYLSYFYPEWHTEYEIADHLESELGWQVDRCDIRHANSRNFVDKCPGYDLVITALPQMLTPGFWWSVKQSGPKLVAWYFDWVFGHANRDKRYIPALKNFDLVVSTDGYEDRYEKYGIKRVWLPHGVDTRVYKPVASNPAIKAEVGFIGHIYTRRRKQMIEALSRMFNMRVFGMEDDCWGHRYSEICSSVPVMVADNYRNDISGYWSDRLYLSLASGAFLLHPAIGGIETQAEDGKHLVLWESVSDLISKIRYYLDRPEERERIAEAGAEHAREHHSWAVRVGEFASLLSESGLLDTRISQVESASFAGNY